jgi:phosphatidylglycerol:prolipoprotein diacylglycerol transferase
MHLSKLLPQPDPIAFSIFGFDIRWYGIMVTAGILLALLVSYVRAEKHRINPDHLISMVLISVPVGVIGARLYYVLFNWDYYAGDLLRILNFREGGLAIHGGLIFGLLTALICCAHWKTRPLNLFDLVVPGIALAQAVGRWGNYFNQEAHGGPTDLPWAIEVGGQMVHPTFLYESVWCFLIFIILLIIGRRRRFEGQIFLLYGILYSIERFFVESLRTDSLMLGPFRAAQVVSALVFLFCLIAYIVMRRRARRSKRRIFG